MLSLDPFNFCILTCLQCNESAVRTDEEDDCHWYPKFGIAFCNLPIDGQTHVDRPQHCPFHAHQYTVVNMDNSGETKHSYVGCR
jgi:hypothetical protein